MITFTKNEYMKDQVLEIICFSTVAFFTAFDLSSIVLSVPNVEVALDGFMASQEDLELHELKQRIISNYIEMACVLSSLIWILYSIIKGKGSKSAEQIKKLGPLIKKLGPLAKKVWPIIVGLLDHSKKGKKN
jgi:uncharacterized protein YqfB (UPF0267 family)